MSIKGGVGKTMLALETASALANDFGKKVLLVDGNFSAPNIGLYLDLVNDVTLHDVLNGEEGLHSAIYESYGIDVVPASMDFKDNVDIYKFKRVLDKYKSRYDFIIIDSSPHHSEMIPVMAAADKIFVVTTPDRVTLTTSLRAAHVAKKNNNHIEGMIINRIRDPRHEMDILEVEKISELPVFAKIKDHKKLGEANFKKVPLNIYDGLNDISKEIKRFSAALCGLNHDKENFLKKFFKLNKFMSRESVNRELMRQKFYTAVL